MPEVVSNTSPLQYLHQLDLLRLLPEFYGAVLIPQTVADELQAGLADGVSLPVIAGHSWLRVQLVRAPAWPLPGDIHRGEAEVLALAAQHPGSLVLLDDRSARQYARSIGLRMTGTAGILLRAKREGKISSVTLLLDRLEALGFHLDETTRANILTIAGEQFS